MRDVEMRGENEAEDNTKTLTSALVDRNTSTNRMLRHMTRSQTAAIRTATHARDTLTRAKAAAA